MGSQGHVFRAHRRFYGDSTGFRVGSRDQVLVFRIWGVQGLESLEFKSS